MIIRFFKKLKLFFLFHHLLCLFVMNVYCFVFIYGMWMKAESIATLTLDHRSFRRTNVPSLIQFSSRRQPVLYLVGLVTQSNLRFQGSSTWWPEHLCLKWIFRSHSTCRSNVVFTITGNGFKEVKNTHSCYSVVDETSV